MLYSVTSSSFSKPHTNLKVPNSALWIHLSLVSLSLSLFQDFSMSRPRGALLVGRIYGCDEMSRVMNGRNTEWMKVHLLFCVCESVLSTLNRTTKVTTKVKPCMPWLLGGPHFRLMKPCSAQWFYSSWKSWFQEAQGRCIDFYMHGA